MPKEVRPLSHRILESPLLTLFSLDLSEDDIRSDLTAEIAQLAIDERIIDGYIERMDALVKSIEGLWHTNYSTAFFLNCD